MKPTLEASLTVYVLRVAARLRDRERIRGFIRLSPWVYSDYGFACDLTPTLSASLARPPPPSPPPSLPLLIPPPRSYSLRLYVWLEFPPGFAAVVSNLGGGSGGGKTGG